MTRLTRRHALTALAAAPLAAPLIARPALAAAPMQGTSLPTYHRIMVGGFEVTALLGGSATREEPQSIFGQNVSAEDFAAASKAAFIPADKVQFFFTPTLVNTGSELVLFDTGLNADRLISVIEASGYTADQIDIVVLTHMHGDHISGMMRGGALAYPNARYVTGAVEFNAWAAQDNEGFEKNVRPVADQTTFLDDGGAVASGITAVAMFGHTPGHMGYMLDSNGAQLLLIADLANHYVWSLAHPDWEVRFDMDKEAAAATRRNILGMLAADRIPMLGYHMPFPAVGYVEAKDSGFRYVPATYQFMM